MAWTRTYDGDEPQRVNKWLAQSGVCSRREAEAPARGGKVDGRVLIGIAALVLVGVAAAAWFLFKPTPAAPPPASPPASPPEVAAPLSAGADFSDFLSDLRQELETDVAPVVES
mgnify:CR=1 FL=1